MRMTSFEQSISKHSASRYLYREHVLLFIFDHVIEFCTRYIYTCFCIAEIQLIVIKYWYQFSLQ